jgi:hypothetical protein
MTRDNLNLGKLGVGFMAVLLVCLLPAATHAEALAFRNETNGPIIVQAACVIRGALRRDRPYLLRPGDSTPGIVLPGNKLITVYDGLNPNVVIFKGAIPGGPADAAFGVSPDGAGGVKLDLKPPAPGP